MNAANLALYHPALVRRAFLLACEAKRTGRPRTVNARELKKARKALLSLLDVTPEPMEEKGDGEQ